MFRSLLYKEFRAHGLQLSLLAVCLFFAYGFILFRSIGSGVTGSAFEQLVDIYNTLYLVAIAMLARLLFVNEFKTDTRQFLYALPVARWKVLFVKISIFLSVTLLFSFLIVSIVSLLQHKSENITLEFFHMLQVRFGLYALSIAAFAFFLSVLGKYRIPAWIAFFFFAIYPDTHKPTYDLIHSLPPFDVIKNAAFEREVWQISELGWCCIFVLLLTLAGVFLSTFKSGDIVYFLYRKMSNTERLTTIALSILVLLTVTFLDEGDEKLSRLGMMEYEEAGLNCYLARMDLLTTADQDLETFVNLIDDIAEKLDKLGIAKGECGDLILIETAKFGHAHLSDYELIENDKTVLLYADYKHEHYFQAYAVYSALCGIMNQHTLERSRLRTSGRWITHGIAGYLAGLSAPDRWHQIQKDYALLYYGRLKEAGITIEELLSNHDCLHLIRKVSPDETDSTDQADLKSVSLTDEVYFSALYMMCFTELAKMSGEDAALEFAKKTVVKKHTHRSWLVNIQEWRNPVRESLEETWGDSADSFYIHLTDYFEKQLTASESL